MSAHTPGPWISTPDPCWHDEAMIGIEGGKPDHVACCALKDAALISAAPDMYEALKDLVDDVCDREDVDSPSCNPGRQSAVKWARAALAKAGSQ